MNDSGAGFKVVGTVLAGLLGLAFGSFLNVCLSRLPEGENIAWPGSHCRSCSHVIAWWENLPLLSWIILRGRCRQCRGWIGVRYPLVELAVGLLWAGCWLKFNAGFLADHEATETFSHALMAMFGRALLCWLLVALATLDVEYFWLPDLITLPGIAAGLIFSILQGLSGNGAIFKLSLLSVLREALMPILFAGGLILFIRLAYWLVRRKEGMGLGDAKLMAMLGAWLGLAGTMESFVLAVLGASVAALLWIAILKVRRDTREWSQMPLPFGTFLCLAAVSEIFFPNWLWIWRMQGIL